MELRHLRYFIALAGSLNFTRAAERVHVTQSTLSHQIRQLEEEIGQRLFDRVGKRVVITAAGETFLAYAARALREIDQGLSELKQSAASLTGELRVGTTHTFNQSFIPDCMARFLQHHPTVRVIIEELAADAIAARLEAGQLDLGVAYRPESTSGLQFEPLFNEELVLVVSAAHPLAARKRIRMIELHREPLVLLTPGFSTRRLLDECFAAAGAEPSVVAETNTIAAMLGMVTRLPVGAIAAPSAVAPSPALRMIPMENPTPMRTPGLLLNREVPQSRPGRAFAALLRKQAMRAYQTHAVS
ncbi:LysR substrate-binding domain-containing protein [Bordetella petrii]|uniref:Transcriptional regulator, LysR-family n=1 Tax=Bordetella petrii (strain ATCC BAA-461 / DSM 12804 / CCUG 43448 / CIP 107267 / Se-1111R) TaxID=340100 RepID=A9IRV5_BORPD|nr:LysR substrate-binding domain-containing protein [Bordetella petrii]CAP43222.1 transcriptional regulator, LysR-family [Bordetella petrii]